MGPPPKLMNDLVSKRIVDAVRAGASRTAAAEAARVGRSTLHSWIARGSKGEEPYASFVVKLREAEGELEGELVSMIKGHGANSWQALAWLAERRWPRRWALRRDRIEREEHVSPEEADKLLADAAKAHAERSK